MLWRTVIMMPAVVTSVYVNACAFTSSVSPRTYTIGYLFLKEQLE